MCVPNTQRAKYSVIYEHSNDEVLCYLQVDNNLWFLPPEVSGQETQFKCNKYVQSYLFLSQT